MPPAEAPTIETDATDITPEHPVMPENRNFINKLSAEELECIPNNPESDREVIESINEQGPLNTRDLMECLSEENQFQLYMLAGGPEATGLSEETHRCIWEGIQPLHKINPEEVDPQEAYKIVSTMMMGTIVLTSFCLSEAEAILFSQTSTQQADEIQFMICMVDHLGGPQEFISAMLQADESPENIMSIAEQACFEELPEPTPPTEISPTP